MKQGHMYVPDMMDILDGFCADFIGGPYGVTSLGSTSGKPHGHGLCIVITAIGFSAASNAVIGRPSKFTTEKDKRFVYLFNFAKARNRASLERQVKRVKGLYTPDKWRRLFRNYLRSGTEVAMGY